MATPAVTSLAPRSGLVRHLDVAALNVRARTATARDILDRACAAIPGRLALVSSFGADSVALLHLVAQIDRGLPVLFIDTRLHFPETLDYQRSVASGLGLTDVRVIQAADNRLSETDPHGALRFSNPDACCRLRKTEPLHAALDGFEGWISGRKRHQGATRADLVPFERDPATGKLKVNPLLRWGPGEAAAYIRRHGLPQHPLVDRGFPSIGCAPCTTPAHAGEDPRAGRWRGQAKTECGIHVVAGRVQRHPTAPAPLRARSPSGDSLAGQPERT